MWKPAVLNRLDRDAPCAPGQLAGLERVSSPAIAACLRALEGRGLVSRQRDPEDRRRAVVAITAAGRRALRDREDAVIARLLRALSHGLAQPERDQLLAAAPLLHRLADSF